jgi:RNA polymerase sigma factor (sigma-70 family)
MTDRLLPFRRGNYCDRLDTTLLSECARGDSGALEELFQRHGDRVHRILSRLRGVDAADLEDLVQTTFFEVHRSARRFDGRAAVETWIVGIAINVMRHHVRGEIRRRTALTKMAGEPSPQRPASPYECSANRQDMARLQEAFERLPRDLKVTFTLCDLEGMRGVEVARALNLPEGTVWRRLHDARNRLKGELLAEETR